MSDTAVFSISRLWQRGPNAERIRHVIRRFDRLSRQERELLLISLDIEEGILPLVHPGGRASRREVLPERRLIAVGDDVAYAQHVAGVLGATAPPASSSEAPPSRTTEAQAPEAARPSRCVTAAEALTLDEVMAEDKLGMSVWFPQFAFGSVDGGQRPAWLGALRPLNFLPWTCQLLAAYDADPRSPLRFFVLGPPIHAQAPHRYGDGALCTFYPPSGCWLRGREGDDLPELMRFAVVWLVRYLCWMTFDGWWPGVEIPHDPRWLLANLRDDDLCPYHMPRRWGACCKGRHVALAAQERVQEMDALVRPTTRRDVG